METINELITKHERWVLGDTEATPAAFHNTELSNTSFRGANLRCADFRSGSYRSCDFYGADLSRSSFKNSDLRKANFSRANLMRADLRFSNLRSVNLYSANLSNARLSQSDLRGAILIGVNFENADLSDCDLREADLRHANFSGANLTNAKLPFHAIVPAKGAFTAWMRFDNFIFEIEVPKQALRLTPLGSRLSRTNIVYVMSAYSLSGARVCDENFSFEIAEGRVFSLFETLYCADFMDDIRESRGYGICIFSSFEEARDAQVS